MLRALDAIFHIVHLTVILINLTFWMSLRTLRIAQVTLGLTLLSWAGFGAWYGFGYCFLTDWHWQVKERLGDTSVPPSYVKLVVNRTFGVDSDPALIDEATIAMLVVALLGCLIQTVRQFLRHRRAG